MPKEVRLTLHEKPRPHRYRRNAADECVTCVAYVANLVPSLAVPGTRDVQSLHGVALGLRQNGGSSDALHGSATTGIALAGSGRLVTT